MSNPKLLQPLLLAMVGAAATCVGCARQESAIAPDQPVTTTPAILTTGTSHTQVQGTGVVTRLLPDDEDGSAHQKFIIRVPSGQTLFIAHNTDLAPAWATRSSTAANTNGIQRAAWSTGRTAILRTSTRMDG